MNVDVACDRPGLRAIGSSNQAAVASVSLLFSFRISFWSGGMPYSTRHGGDDSTCLKGVMDMVAGPCSALANMWDS